MYVTDESVTITWDIAYADRGLTQDFFDIVLVAPDGSSTYLVDPATTFVTPNLYKGYPSNGTLTYDFNPDAPGRWILKLVNGNAALHTPLDILHIFSQCEIPTPSPNNMPFQPATALVGVRICIPDREMQRSPPWLDIQALGRGAVKGTIVVAGRYDTANPLNRAADVGIYTIATNSWEILHSALINIPIVSNVSEWAGIDCDRETGVFVLTPQGQTTSNNKYDAYWSTDLVNWTLCTAPNTDFHGGDCVRFDNKLETWTWFSGSQTYVSDDGKTFVSQHGALQGAGSGTTNIGFTKAMALQANINPLDNGVSIYPGDFGFAYRGEPTSIPEIPMTSGPSHGLANMRSISENDFNAGSFFGHTDDNDWEAGIAVSEPGDSQPRVFMMNDRGEIVMNEGDLYLPTWQVIAEADVGQGFPNGGPNELTELGGTGIREFLRIGGKFWCNNGGLSWYCYDGEVPIGYGWELAPAIPTENDFDSFPYSDGVRTAMNKQTELVVEDESFAYAGTLEGGTDNYVFVDKLNRGFF